MKFSHISDTHLGLIQYGLEEREQDIYDSFNQAIDISIQDKVDFVFLQEIFFILQIQVGLQFYKWQMH